MTSWCSRCVAGGGTDGRPSLSLPYLTVAILTLPYLTLSYPTLPHLTLPYLTLLYFTLPYLAVAILTWYPYLTFPYDALPDLTLPYLSLSYLTLAYLTFPRLTLPSRTCLYFALQYLTSPDVTASEVAIDIINAFQEIMLKCSNIHYKFDSGITYTLSYNALLEPMWVSMRTLHCKHYIPTKRMNRINVFNESS